MTQATDLTAEIIRWLAEQPCPECGGRGTHIKSFPAGRDDVDCPTQGLAFPWVSESCTGRITCPDPECGDSTWDHYCKIGAHDETCCNGSHRVPKDVGLPELWEHGLYSVTHLGTKDYEAVLCNGKGHAYGETPMLAALRAVAKQAGMP